jgi:hypothetical protein
MPIFSSSRLKETIVNGTCEIIANYREIYLFQTVNKKEQKLLIYKKGNCAFKGKEYSPKDESALINIQVILNLVKTATDYFGFCSQNKSNI